MEIWTNDELAGLIAAAHAASLVDEIERYLAAVAAFDAEGVPPFADARAPLARAGGRP